MRPRTHTHIQAQIRHALCWRLLLAALAGAPGTRCVPIDAKPVSARAWRIDPPPLPGTLHSNSEWGSLALSLFASDTDLDCAQHAGTSLFLERRCATVRMNHAAWCAVDDCSLTCCRCAPPSRATAVSSHCRGAVGMTRRRNRGGVGRSGKLADARGVLNWCVADEHAALLLGSACRR